jgi:hypothetical protein
VATPHDTPVDTPQVEAEPVVRKSKQEQAQDVAWAAQAAQLKADGYNAAVVARKMIQVHGMPEAEAEVLVSTVFGKKVNARAGDTTGEVVQGLAMAAAGLGGAAVLFMVMGLAFLKFTFFAYLALLGLAGKGGTQAFIALVNSDVKTPLKK